MRIYHFTEQPYPNAWRDGVASLRVNLPNRECDPRVAADIYHRHEDEWCLSDELGLDIMVNEHHATATCITSVCTITLGILARITKRARILTLGMPIANRVDPVRIAEEFATIDVISRGRFDMGLVRGVPYELAVSPRSAVGQMDRFWEAHDLILKALSTRDGPFDWQGEYFQYRNVNVWPQCWQQPHPPVWITGAAPINIREIAARGYVLATFLSGFRTKDLFDHYRAACVELGRPQPTPDRFAYLGLVAVASTTQEALRRAEILMGYIKTSSIVADPFKTPPGYFSPTDAVRQLKSNVKRATMTREGKSVNILEGSVQDLIDSGVIFAGTPDEVYKQIVSFRDRCGGLGNLLAMCQAGHLSHEDTVDSLTLLAKEVLPRLQADSEAMLKQAA